MIDKHKMSAQIIAWQKSFGRHDLPWQKNRDAYRVWLSEIMLQQTQVTTVIPYFQRFVSRFSDIHSLSAAHIDEVLFLWAGLGYYSRAKNLHRTARIIVHEHAGKFPSTLQQLERLPGIGRSTAGAIMALAFGQPTPILDGNVKRVLARLFGVKEPINLRLTEKKLWSLSEQLVPSDQSRVYTQGIMDLGATVCVAKNPRCSICPIQPSCWAKRKSVQNELPVRQRKTVKPIKSGVFVMVSQHQRILLKKRPDKGIWSGLWCLPQKDELAQLQQGKFWAMGPEWLKFRHTFSHFYLDCTVCQACVEGLYLLPEGWVWYNGYCPMEIGLATPMKKIIGKWLDSERSQVHLNVAESSDDYSNGSGGLTT